MLLYQVTRYELGEFTSNGIEAPEYISGGRLTAEDLRAEADAGRDRALLLGRAAGHGIVSGLEVQQEGPSLLVVLRGLGVAKDGTLISLRRPITLDITRVSQFADMPETIKPLIRKDVPTPRATFRDCDAPFPGKDPSSGQPDTRTKLLPGVYLLVAYQNGCLQAFATEPGKLPTNPRLYDGVRFRLVPLPESLQRHPKEMDSLYRNRLAYAFFGTDDLTRALHDPFGLASDRPLPFLEEQHRSEELPLAVVVIAPGIDDGDQEPDIAIALVEQWAARRSMVQPPTADDWEPITGSRRAATGQARFYQFQSHLGALSTDLGRWDSTLRWVPPVGYLPLWLGEDMMALLRQLDPVWFGPYWNPQGPAPDMIAVPDRDLTVQAIEAMRTLTEPLMATFWEARDDILGALLRASLIPVYPVSPSRFFPGFDLRWQAATVDTGHHALNRSWFDPPIDLSRPELIDLLIVPETVVRLFGIVATWVLCVNDSYSALDDVRSAVKILRALWGITMVEGEELYTSGDQEVIHERVSDSLGLSVRTFIMPWVVYARAEPRQRMRVTRDGPIPVDDPFIPR